MSKYDDLVRKLKEIFQIDRPELDFGVYRILNCRAGEINDYLENRLKAKVLESLATSGAANVAGQQRELHEKEAQYRADGIDPETVPKVILLRKKLADYSVGSSEHENAVFTHLLAFFSRYYDKGDFISRRRYKGDTYAIPYAGEEVVLHWANKDQYYTKSGENFANYAFKLDDGRTVRFRLVTADTAKDNRKDNDKERRFVLIERHTRILTDDEGDEYEEELLPVAEENGELILRFEYKGMPKGSKQDALVLDAVKKVLDDASVKARWLDLSMREPTEKNPQRTMLEKCLTNYTTKNLADYFIHKDLGGFLRRELDFYIKSEVLHLDDVQNAEKFADIEKNLRLIQTLRAIALDLITFLAQLEDFQKKLWLKKKFVISTHYCVTLDRLPESLYPAIAANQQQWDQWEKLGMLDGNKADLFKQAKAGSVAYLKEHHHLMADTALFDATFKQALLAAVDNLDESLDGLLIHGDNFQALNLLQVRFQGQVKCVYIDPPYNTNATEIIYKNGYKQSSWMSLISSRLDISKKLLAIDGALAGTIDDYELTKLGEILDSQFGEENRLGIVAIRINPKGRMTNRKVSLTHEYALIYGASEASSVKKLPVTPEEKTHNYKQDEDGTWYLPVNLRKQGVDSEAIRSDGTYFDRYYPIYFDPENGRVSSKIELDIIITPTDSAGQERNWRRSKDDIDRMYEAGDIWVSETNNGYQVYFKFRGGLDGKMVQSLWTDSKYSASDHGTRILDNLLGKRELFSYPKSPFAVEDTILAMTDSKVALVLDYFGGSGTTGHAVISLNRHDSGHRKYILVEQGEYFDTVMKPRIQKVVYSADWKDGKATAPQTGISHAFKVLKIESYEDTLNNLQLHRTSQQQDLLDTLPPPAQEDYLLRYLLDIESRGSLLSVEQFSKPFDCKLKVTVDSAGAYKERTIDLVETFNYLIGLRVKHIDMQRDLGFVCVTGWLPTGEKTLVLWRDTEQVDYEKLNRLCDKLAINPADSEFEVVYINGDHNIPAVFTSTEAEGGITKTLKIRQIEPEFLSRMFAVEGM